MPDPAAPVRGHAPDPDRDAGGHSADLERALGYTFVDGELLRTALTHRSFMNEVDVPDTTDNERLEFLGDALLDFVAGEYLFRRMPASREGDLTEMRARLVCEATLATFAQAIELGSHIRVGRGEQTTGGRDRPAILSNTFEAVVGAMYLDGGLAAASAFVLRFFEVETDRALEGQRLKDAKSLFQELAQRAWQITPQYRTVAESGPDHDKRFRVEVLVGDESWGVGDGRSKAMAARRAAQMAVARFRETGTGDRDSEQGAVAAAHGVPGTSLPS